MIKTILCYGDSNLRGFIPDSYDEKTGLSGRYSKDTRWTGVLQNRLGSHFYVVEEGLNGRTTDLNEIIPGRSFRNGLAHLPFVLESHFPVDLIIFMLGTNDTKKQFNRSAIEIKEAMRGIVRFVKTCDWGPSGGSPRIFLIASPPLLEESLEWDDRLDEESIEKSRLLGNFYKQLAIEEDCEFLDASLIIQTSKKDGVHFEAKEHEILGDSIAKKVKQLFSL